jgi:glutathione S-transferase
MTSATTSSASSSNESGNYVLTYFDARAAGELSRIIMSVAGIQFTDERYSAKLVEGKYLTPEFDAAKENGLLDTNLNRVPILNANGITIGQSKAIERYLSKKSGMFGTTMEEEAIIDSIAEHVRDIKEKWGKIRFMGGMSAAPNPEKDAAIAKWFDEDLGEWLRKLEKSLVYSASSGYVLGATLTYADLCIWQLLADYFDERYVPAIQKFLEETPKLRAIVENVKGHEGLRKYLESRPITMF